MDPNATLARIRALRSWWRDVEAGTVPRPSEQTLRELAEELTDLLEALDEWLSKGGFPPEAWRQDEGTLRRKATALRNQRAAALRLTEAGAPIDAATLRRVLGAA